MRLKFREAINLDAKYLQGVVDRHLSRRRTRDADPDPLDPGTRFGRVHQTR
jgi:hypothetical protein